MNGPSLRAPCTTGRSRSVDLSVVRPLDAGEAMVWLVGPDGLADSGALCGDDLLIGHEERERAARFRHNRDRRRFTTGRFLLRAVLGAYLQVDPGLLGFIAGPHGKLLSANPDHRRIRFNLSHTDELVVAAFALDREVGVDVERVRPNALDAQIARHHFAADEFEEWTSLPESDRSARFFELWVLKESYTKALGVGLHLPFKSFTFTFGDNARSKLRLQRDCDSSELASTLWLASFRPDDRIALTILGHPRRHRVLAYRLFGDGTAKNLECTVIRT